MSANPPGSGPSPAIRDRVYGLDILRAFAILFVVYSHAGYLLVGHVDGFIYRAPSMDGVSMFFVLSGFLIGRILLRTAWDAPLSSNSMLLFWMNRWFRTLPAYFAVLLTLIVIHWSVRGEMPSQYWKYLFFVQNLDGPNPPFFGEAWSLSVEEWFYLLFPILLLLAIRWTQPSSGATSRAFILLAIGIVVAVTAYRGYRVGNAGCLDINCWDEQIRKVVSMRMDSIAFGIIGAWLSLARSHWWYNARVGTVCAGLAILMADKWFVYFVASVHYRDYVHLSATGIGTMLLLPLLGSIRTGSGVAHRFLTVTSRLSYAMYLVNYSLIQHWVIPAMFSGSPSDWSGRKALFVCCVFWVLTYAAAWALHVAVERPLMEARRSLGMRLVSMFRGGGLARPGQGVP